MQSEVFEYFLNGGDAQLLVCEDDKEAIAALSAAEFAGLKVFRLPDFRAREGDDLRSFSAELFELSSELAKFYEFEGKKLLITAGPTYEMIDPVRFVGNFSSGKMGVALSNMAARMGGEVTLILGPTAPHTIESSVKVCPVVSAQQMYEAAQEAFAHTDIAILAAAVADYKPMVQAPQKIKKKTDQLTLELTKTQDILASLGAQKDKQLLIGFALETENEIENARTKLQKKHLDGIVLNSLRDKGAGFGTDTNKITFITPEKLQEFPLKSKEAVAKDILTECINL